METRHINYKSDFVLRERFRNAAGEIVPLPDVDFELRYWVKPNKVFTAKRENGVMTNCVADGDAVLVILKDHALGEGELKHELHLALDNALFRDGIQNVYYPESLHVLLWDKRGDTEGVVECDTVAAYTRGYKFTFEDFTPADIEQLQQPAREATDAANAAAGRAEQATLDANASKDAADEATRQTLLAKEQTETATRQANASKDAADEATRLTLLAKEQTETATRQANASKDAADEATRLTLLAKEQTETATHNASEAAQSADGYLERLAAAQAMFEDMAARAEAASRDVPTGLRLVLPKTVTLGNNVAQYVRATVLPVNARQNVLYLGDGGACEVEPDGRIVAKQPGTSRVHIVPTGATQHYKTIYIEVTEPSIRTAGATMRIDRQGNIRLT